MERNITLSVAEGGQRLDKFVTEALADLSRAAVQRLIADGLLNVNGHSIKAAYKLNTGDVITVRIPPPKPSELVPEAIPLDIVYEDGDLIVVNKPAGLVVHPAAGHTSGTLVNAVLAHCPDLAGVGGTLRPGIVHRLDKDTSGLIVVAKHDAAHQALQHQFKARSVDKLYLALVEGQPIPPQGIIDAPIGRDRAQRKRMAVVPDGRPAVTEYKVIECFDKHSLIEARPRTGRTHQIRVHLAWLKFPVVGDRVYGFHHPNIPINRHFLHAHSLSFDLLADGRRTTFIAPLPPDLAAILAELRRG
ncbi:MAG: RluA family pseudouridine synthase [Thermoflexales bacterium]|nr:RluA family pseudouridine synthase [Thermoflexales bacterium]